jgi:hypothetical protein
MSKKLRDKELEKAGEEAAKSFDNLKLNFSIISWKFIGIFLSILIIVILFFIV